MYIRSLFYLTPWIGDRCLLKYWSPHHWYFFAIFFENFGSVIFWFISMNQPVVIVGAPRSGTTLLSSILSCSGIRTGLPDRAWNPASGYYEHPLLISCYGDLKKSRLLANYSDSLSNYFRNRALQKLKILSTHSQLFKFPLLSFMLPPLLRQIGFKPIAIVIYRPFSAYANSYFRLRPYISYFEIKKIYLETYYQSLLLPSICTTLFLSYDELCSSSGLSQFEVLTKYLNIDLNKLMQCRILGEASISIWAFLFEDLEWRFVQSYIFKPLFYDVDQSWGT